MSAVVRLAPGTMKHEPLTPEAARAALEGAGPRADEIEHSRRAFRKAGWIVGGVGSLVGLLGMATAAWVLVRAEPTRTHFALVDSVTNRVTATVPAADAPQLFSDDTARHYLRAFVENCDGYLRPAVTQMLERCTTLMNPAMQSRYRDEFTAANPQSPQRLYNAQNVSILPNAFRFAAYPGEGRIKTWIVRYRRWEVSSAGQGTPRDYAATVHFEWRPELPMTKEAREINPAGMQVVGYTFEPDKGQ